jgi:hypothetical protein
MPTIRAGRVPKTRRSRSQSQWVIASHTEKLFLPAWGWRPPTLRYGAASPHEWARGKSAVLCRTSAWQETPPRSFQKPNEFAEIKANEDDDEHEHEVGAQNWEKHKRTERNTKGQLFSRFFLSRYSPRGRLMSIESDPIRPKDVFGNLFMKHGAVQGGFCNRSSRGQTSAWAERRPRKTSVPLQPFHFELLPGTKKITLEA